MDEGMILEIKKRALLLFVDNPKLYANLYAVEAAMMIGASIVIERGGPDLIPDEGEHDAELEALFNPPMA